MLGSGICLHLAVDDRLVPRLLDSHTLSKKWSQAVQL